MADQSKLSGCKLDGVVLRTIQLVSNPQDDQVALDVEFLLVGGGQGALESPQLVVQGKHVVWPKAVTDQAISLAREIRSHMEATYFIGGGGKKRKVDKSDPLGIIGKRKPEDEQL